VAVESLLGNVLEQSRRDIVREGSRAVEGISVVASSARQQVCNGKTRSEALMREITGQGPEKTLNRGFALVRDQSGQAITRMNQTLSESTIEIQFSDGKVSATTGKQL
jgi:exodeoxyribonuclease VII large subunit